jgi:antitoxin component HigA of HigAB toxin-antitoxin module
MAIPGSARTRQAGKLRATRRRPRASASYLALARAYPIHPIRDDGDLDEAVAVVDRLLGRRKRLDAQEQDYLDSLSHEIERYEAAAYPLPAVSGAAMLRHLIEARGATLTEVAAATGIAVSTLAAVLAKKRKLNLAHIGVLAPYFGVQPGVFLD